MRTGELAAHPLPNDYGSVSSDPYEPGRPNRASACDPTKGAKLLSLVLARKLLRIPLGSLFFLAT